MNKLTRIFGKKKKSGSSYGAIVNTSNNDMPQTVSSSLMEVKESEAESTEVDLLMQELDADFTIMEVMGGLFMYFSVGICAYSFVFENWNIRDSIYFSVLTFTTIGYGDIYPTTHLGRLFTVLYAFFGVALICVIVQETADDLVSYAFHAVVRKTLGIKEEKPQENSDSKVEEIIDDSTNKQNRKRRIPSWLPHCLGPFIIFSFVVLGAVYIGSKEDWDWSTCIYFAMITSLTIGFGDMTPTTNSRMFAIFYILFTFATTSYCFGSIVSYLVHQKRKRILQHFESKELTWDDFKIMDLKNDNKISEAEFMAYILIKMNIVEKDLITDLYTRFRPLDPNHTGYFDKKDVDSWNAKLREERVAKAKAMSFRF